LSIGVVTGRAKVSFGELLHAVARPVAVDEAVAQPILHFK
jgi:hypothetical protein